MMTIGEAENENFCVSRRIERQKCATHQAAETGQRRTEQEGDEEDKADIDARGFHHLRIVDAGADQCAEPCLLQQQPQAG